MCSFIPLCNSFLFRVLRTLQCTAKWAHDIILFYPAPCYVLQYWLVTAEWALQKGYVRNWLKINPTHDFHTSGR